jgi:hypothetical protein
MAGQPVMAGRRDASAYNNPSQYAPRRVHVAAENDRHRAACDSGIILQERLVEAERIPRMVRCRRSGCASRWPKEAG